MSPTVRKPTSTTPTTPPVRPNPTVIGKFSIDGIVCELICVHGKSEGEITTEELTARGKIAGADMSWNDGDYLLNHRWDIPSEFPETIIVFPYWNSEKYDGEKDGKIRGLDNRGVNWWCEQSFPKENTWNSKCVLLRFDDVSYLPPATDK